MENFDYADVKLVSIDSDLKDELCMIMYSDEYKKLMGLLFGLMAKQEYSERALAVTRSAIETVPAFYTAWNYRFEICASLFQRDPNKWDEELDWLDELTLNNPKNYQIWSYRQSLLQEHPEPKLVRELPILDIMIDDDTKNYHVWSYRKWCIRYFNDWSHELEFVNKYIDRDVYNNSAWSHRMFYLKNVDGSEDLIDTEIDYIIAKISLAPQNVSPWNYLRFIYQRFRKNKFDKDITQFAAQFTDGLLDQEKVSYQVRSSFALEFLADIYSVTDKDKSRKAYAALAESFDPIRKKYWNHRIAS